MKNDPRSNARFPYTYAADYIREAMQDHSPDLMLSRSEAAHIETMCAAALGIDRETLAKSLAEIYILKHYPKWAKKQPVEIDNPLEDLNLYNIEQLNPFAVFNITLQFNGRHVKWFAKNDAFNVTIEAHSAEELHEKVIERIIQATTSELKRPT